jgi:hypothetical protein
MTSVAPPPPPPPPTAGASAAQLTATIAPTGSAAVQLSQMALDSLITGLVKPSPTQGETLLQTNLGPLQFKAPFNLPEGAQATFKLVQTQPSVQIQLTHINGKALPPGTAATRVASFATQTLQNPTSQTVGQPAQNATTGLNAPATTLNLNTATGLRAFVLSATPPQQTSSLSAQIQPSGTSVSLPSGTATPKNTPLINNPEAQNSPNTAAKTGTSPTASTPASAKTNAPSLQPGNQLNVRLLSVQLPGQPQNTTSVPSTSTSTLITQGTVQGHTAGAQPIIKVPQGLIALDTAAKMPDGTQVKLEILSSSKSSISASNPNTQIQQTPPQQSIGGNWPALEEALTSLRDINPNLADHLQNTLMPKPDTRLAANLIFFLKALGRGQFKSWADERSLKALGKAKPDLLKKLEGDFTELSKKAKTSNSTDWKIAYIPMQDQDQIQQIRIAQRDHRDEEKDGKDEPGIRFVIDLNLSRIGALQLDGLAKDKARKFDLIMRSKNALPGFMRKQIHDIFENGMQAIGFDGKISFQVTPRFVEIEGVEAQKGELNLAMLV